MIKQCERCKEFIFRNFNGDQVCRCKPFSIVDENDEDCGTYHALSDEYAAEKYAEESNESGDYYLMGESVIITVTDSDGVEKKFKISAEPSINYSAEEVEETNTD